MRKSLFTGTSDYNHRTVQPLGILLVNLGTPDAPTPEALKPYLKKFLSDSRVIEYSKIPWWIILNLFILPFRPKRSAALYQKIWMKEGSPLLVYSQKQLEKLRVALGKSLNVPFELELGMRIGNPSLEDALERLRQKHVKQLLVLPLFPQYSSTTTGTAFDAVADVLKTWRWIPEFRMVTTYHDHPLYIASLANSVRELWSRDGKPDKLVISFHGMPKRYFLDGDPYFCLCQKTGRLLCEALGLKDNEFLITFQSLFGREEWIKPYTDETLKSLARSGVEKVDVICPAFTSDCLETLEEIQEGSREIFLHEGGKQFRYIPAVNDRDDFIAALESVIEKNILGWTGAEEENSAEGRMARVAQVGKLSGLS